MEQPVLLNSVLHHFRYLMDEHGFALVNEKNDYDTPFGSRIVILQSPECRVRFVRDRGQVLVAAASLTQPEDWFDLAVVNAYLLRENRVQWEYPTPDHSLDPAARIDKQIARLADILSPHWVQIIDLFRQENFAREIKDLEAFIVIWNTQILKDRGGINPFG